jgi:hypothetical protein
VSDDHGERLARLEERLGAHEESFDRDLADHRKMLADVDERATRADRFVRRVLTGAISGTLGIVIAAITLIYQAGTRSAEARAASEATRAELARRIELVDDGLTELRKSVRLLLEADLSRRTTP